VTAPGLRRPTLALAAGFVLFTILATANAGGYRYGASDQAFYEPAIALAGHPALFPRDRELLSPQMALWVGDTVLAALARWSSASAPGFAAGIYALTLVILFASAVALARALGATPAATAAFLTLVTLRHQITRTGANSLEGYMHPRMLAFAIGLSAFAWIVRQRPREALVFAGAAMVIHTTTGLWFVLAAGVAAAWSAYHAPRPRKAALALAGGLVVVLAVALLSTDRFASRLVFMDALWVDALGDRDYLFSDSWPVHAWLANLAYPVVLVLIFRRRLAAGVATPGESGLVVGLLALVALFLLSLPLTGLRLALAVQLQVNRVFWLLDAVVACYAAWWLVDCAGGRRSAAVRHAIVAVLLLASAARGAYLIGVSPGRPLVQTGLPETPWTDAMRWVAAQPTDVHVLADPQHAWRYGPSVRVSARRDTLLDAGKDPALAIYDRGTARRVAARGHALAGFDSFTTADVLSVAAEYDLDVFVDHNTRRFDLPVLYRNDGFIVYDLR
jgi:hypothetical protein